MDYFDVLALVIGAGLIGSGVIAVRRRRAKIPELHSGKTATAIGWLWIGMGSLFIIGVLFDIGTVKWLFRLFSQAPN